MSRTPASPSDWSTHDSALWYTCEIAADLVGGRHPQSVPEVLAPFPPPAPDSQFWASGPFQLLNHQAPGDGSYMRNEGFFFATGAAGLALTAATAVGRAAANSSRRRAAEQAAVPRWMAIADGQVYVAPSSFTMYSAAGLWQWPHYSVNVAQMVGPGHMHFQGSSDGGPISWILGSDWAELIFVTWALRNHPRHPQLLDGSWLPPDFLAKCATHSYTTRLTTPTLAISA